MKKVIAFLTIMAVFSTAVFAAPLSVAGSLDTASSEFSLAGQTSADPNGFDDLFADVNAAALTQEEAAAAESGSVLPVILHGDSLGMPLRAGDFVLPGGTNLSTEELKQRLFTVPENDKYVSRAGGWTAAYWTAFGIGCAAAAMDIVYLFNEDLPYRTPMIAALSGGVLLGIVTGDLFIVMRNRNLNRAVRNYNLSVMGIPIP